MCHHSYQKKTTPIFLWLTRKEDSNIVNSLGYYLYMVRDTVKEVKPEDKCLVGQKAAGKVHSALTVVLK